MIVHGGLGLAGGAGGEAEQRHVVGGGRHRRERCRLVQRQAVEFGVVVGAAVEGDHPLQEVAVRRTLLQFVEQAAVAQGERHFGLVDDPGELSGAQHRHGVDHHCAGLGGGEPAGHQRRVVGRADQHPVARAHAELLDQGVGEAIGPLGEFPVGATAAVADQGHALAVALLDQAIAEFHRGVEPCRVVEALEQEIGLLLGGWQVVPGKGIGMGRWAVHDHSPYVVLLLCGAGSGRRQGYGVWRVVVVSYSARQLRAMTTFCTSEAPS